MARKQLLALVLLALVVGSYCAAAGGKAETAALEDEDDEDLSSMEAEDDPPPPPKPPPPPPPPPFTKLSAADFAETVSQDASWRPWVVLFDDMSNDELVALFGKMAKGLRTMYRFGVVDVQKDAALAKAHGYTDKAEIRVFSAEGAGSLAGRKAAPLQLGEKPSMGAAVKALGAFVDGQHVYQVGKGKLDVQTLIQSIKPGVPKVFLFTDKPASGLYKALANEFANRLVLSLIPHTEDETVKQFGVKSFPTLMLSGEGQEPGQISLMPYSGKFSWKALTAFLGPKAVDPPTLATAANQADVEGRCKQAQCMLLVMSEDDAAAQKTGQAILDTTNGLSVLRVVASPLVQAAFGIDAKALPASVYTFGAQGIWKSGPSGAELTAAMVAGFLQTTQQSLMSMFGESADAAAKEAALKTFGKLPASELPALFPEAVAAKQKLLAGDTAVFNLTSTTFQGLVGSSRHQWAIMYCTGPCEDDARNWEKMAKASRGVVWCGRVDVAESPDLKPEGGAEKPTVLVYEFGITAKAQPPTLYAGKMTVDAFRGEMADKLTLAISPFTVLDQANINSFLQNNFQTGDKTPVALIFTDDDDKSKKINLGGTTTGVLPMAKALSYHYKGGIGVATIAKDLVQMLSKTMQFQPVHSYPSMQLLSVREVAGKDGKPEKDKDGKPVMSLFPQAYRGKWDFKSLHRFLKMTAKPIDDIGVEPAKYAAMEVKEITQAVSPQAACGKAQLCVIGIFDSVDPDTKKEHLPLLTALALRKAAGGKVAVAWIDGAAQTEFLQAMGGPLMPTAIVADPTSFVYDSLIGRMEIGSLTKLVDRALRSGPRMRARWNTFEGKTWPKIIKPIAIEVASDEDDDFMKEFLAEQKAAEDKANAEREAAKPKKKKRKKGKKKKKKKKKKSGLSDDENFAFLEEL